VIVISPTTNPGRFAELTGAAAYASGVMINPVCAAINKAAFAKATDGKLPCYAAWIGKRGSVAWVSFGSSCKIGRGNAKQWLQWCGVDIDEVEKVGA
jgi:hypothetical protein